MSKILFVKQVPLNLFYKRRISRILPIFYFYFCSLFIDYFIIGSGEYRNFAYTFLFLRSYFPVNIHVRSEVSAAPLLLSAGYFLVHQRLADLRLNYCIIVLIY